MGSQRVGHDRETFSFTPAFTTNAKGTSLGGKQTNNLKETCVCVCRLLYQNLTGTANQRTTVNTCMKKKTQLKHNTKDSHQITREQKKGRKKTYQNKKNKTTKQLRNCQ